MDFIDVKLLTYAESHSEDENLLLKELNRETQSRILYPRMISGHLQGRALSMFSRMIRPTNILEIGTFTGYSAICLSEGLQPHGELITIDNNDELSDMVQRYIDKSGMNSKIRHICGNALEVIPNLHTNFDLVFIDADKENYSRYYDMVFEQVNPGGFIIADNVLWSGQVLDPAEKQSHETQMIDAFNKKVKDDTRVSPVLLPIRDGLMVIQKKY